MSDSDMDGKIVLITGAATGIGASYAAYFAERGAHVVVADLDAEGARKEADTLASAGWSAEGVGIDVRDSAAVRRMFRDVVSRTGRMDVCIANAGAIGPEAFEDTEPEDWDVVIDVNTKGVIHTCQAASEYMKKQQSGRILVTLSYNAFRTGAHVISYRVSKAGAFMFVKCLALVMAPYGVTVNGIAPGVTLTQMQKGYAQEVAQRQGVTLDEYFEARRERIPMKQFTTFEDLNGLAGFLVSDAARHITGQAIAPDGGVLASS